MMKTLRKLLYPFVPAYYFITWLRNKLYDAGIKKSKSYNFPVIAVGNLSVGGTGKSPMIEYLIRLLKERCTVATLSRGYKRSTVGFQLVRTSHSAEEIGDEPLQFKLKFRDVLVAVDANRQQGIEMLRTQVHPPDVILLDDAYQHRKVKAGFYILLTTYYQMYVDDIVLPTGNLREPRSGADRANIIVVTKCPPDISIQEREQITQRLQVKSHQRVFFTSIAYGSQLMSAQATLDLENLKDSSFTLITGIANPKPLVDYYMNLGLKFQHISFSDHYNFTATDIDDFKERGLIITTEKDYVRLKKRLSPETLFYQPIEVSFIDQKENFDKIIGEYLINQL
ncbi:tetraacyldisaccharide 4'-kinase [Aquimarina intermedia]|nr:tetraacyldisaccharide 4'-kinase [Aquimarina intermedia]